MRELGGFEIVDCEQAELAVHFLAAYFNTNARNKVFDGKWAAIRPTTLSAGLRGLDCEQTRCVEGKHSWRSRVGRVFCSLSPRPQFCPFPFLVSLAMAQALGWRRSYLSTYFGVYLD